MLIMINEDSSVVLWIAEQNVLPYLQEVCYADCASICLPGYLDVIYFHSGIEQSV